MAEHGGPRPPTLLVTPNALAAARVSVQGETFRHLFRARRLAVGERVRVVDGAGGAREGVIADVAGRSADVDLGAPTPTFEPERSVRLYPTTLRPQRATWLVEKATEVGVAAIEFQLSDRAPRRFEEAQLERLRRVARAALEQSGRAVLPTVSFSDQSGPPPEEGPDVARWYLDLDAPVGLEAVVRDAPAEIALCIGPEGGWSDAEREAFQEAGWDSVRLGPSTLRTETAAVVAAFYCLVGESAALR